MEVKIKGVYKHFKGDYYIVEDIANDAESLKKLVLYRGLYENAPLWARTYDDFLKEVNHEKYTKVEQQYCFELQEIKSQRTNFKA